jgi:hypothetical protein
VYQTNSEEILGPYPALLMLPFLLPYKEQENATAEGNG